MATKNCKTKTKFYILTTIGFLITIGIFILGFVLNIYGSDFRYLPTYKLFIFYGCIIFGGVYFHYYMKYAVRHDNVLTKKKLK